jgi:hypothetical protein
MSFRNFGFTLNYYTDVDASLAVANSFIPELDNIFSDPLFKYVVLQLEIGTKCGRVHFQGYIEMTKTARPNQVRAKCGMNFLEHAVFYERRGTRDEMITYCTKERTRIEGYGPYQLKATEADEVAPKSTFDDLTKWILDNPGVTEGEVAMKFPVLWIMKGAGIKDWMSYLPKPIVGDPEFKASDWQQRLLDGIAGDADDRSIHWVCDESGGAGKSRLAAHLRLTRNAMTLQGRIQDMTMAYVHRMVDVCIFDISRSAVEMSDHLYTMAENLKNGVLMNSKYQSKEYSFKPPHVIFFCNQMYQEGKWTGDRIKLHKLTAADKYVAPVEDEVGEIVTPAVTEVPDDFVFDADEIDDLLADFFGAAEANRFM